MRKYLYDLIERYLLFYLPGDGVLIEANPLNSLILDRFRSARAFFTGIAGGMEGITGGREWRKGDQQPDYVLLHGSVHYERDLQNFFQDIHGVCAPSTRVVIIYYSSFWKPLMRLASYLNIRSRTPEQNWISHEDIENILRLSDFELIKRESKVLVPFYIPVLSNFINRFIAPLYFFRAFTLLNIVIAKPVSRTRESQQSVSIIVPARNEAGNIEKILQRIPLMGPDDEIIFIEGHSRDTTWDTIAAMAEKYGNQRKIIIARQDGEGKGDAVRKGFSLARKDILMIFDADISVQPEDLVKFYEAIITDKGEFINGSRLVYPMEKNAMRFLNMIGNKFFALGFSFVLGQRFKDTLCGTKVLTRENYLKLEKGRSYFGDFDPFGDFDLIFGAARLGLRIVEIPVVYGERTYGETNIQRWRHGFMLLKMLGFSALKIKFI